MNGRQARGWGISAHEMTKTTTKNAANSIVGKLTAGILATAAVLPAPALAQQPVSGERVLVVGDSLEVGSGPYLRRLLPGARVDAVKGRTSGQGVQVLGARLDPSVSVVVFPLGTNDSPSNPAGLAASFAAVRQLAGDRCVVVATIARRGVPVGGLNRVVAEFAESARAQVADWQTVVRSLPELLVSDGVHATGEGYGVRAGLLAEAVQACGTGGGGGATGATGLPAPRDPNAAPPERVAAPAALPSGATAPLSALGALGRAALRPVVSAVRAALTTASKEGPEPVLGEP
jgi:lysophospholipase L1-like esterase